MPEVVSTERIIPWFVTRSLTPTPSLDNKWVTEPFQEYVYCEDVITTYKDGTTEKGRGENKCQPVNIQYLYQVNEQGERDGMFIAFLDDGRLHYISVWSKGKLGEHHCIVQQNADSTRLQQIDCHGIVFWRSNGEPRDGVTMKLDMPGGKKITEVACRKGDEDIWRQPVPAECGTTLTHTEAK